MNWRSTMVSLLVLASAAGAVEPAFPGPSTEAVVLDIGHSRLDCGAISPVLADGTRLTEFDFWYEYCY